MSSYFNKLMSSIKSQEYIANMPNAQKSKNLNIIIKY